MINSQTRFSRERKILMKNILFLLFDSFLHVDHESQNTLYFRTLYRHMYIYVRVFNFHFFTNITNAVLAINVDFYSYVASFLRMSDLFIPPLVIINHQ